MTDDRILEKKLEHYATEPEDFTADGELTVTVTLNEYRALLKDSVELRFIKRERDKLLKERERACEPAEGAGELNQTPLRKGVL